MKNIFSSKTFNHFYMTRKLQKRQIEKKSVLKILKAIFKFSMKTMYRIFHDAVYKIV